jgi:hypothetical protein
MGAGNPKLKSFDNDRYEPTTFFINLGSNFDFESYKKEMEEANETEYSDETIWDMHGEDLELNFDDLVESICSELGHKAHDLNDRRNFHSELCYSFREDGMILTEGKQCYVISETGSEYTHLPIAIIPNFKFEDILDEVKCDNSDKEEWYIQRGKDFDAAMEKRAEKIWNKNMKEFFKEENEIVEKLKLFYSKSLYQRNGPWMSSLVA